MLIGRHRDRGRPGLPRRSVMSLGGFPTVVSGSAWSHAHRSAAWRIDDDSPSVLGAVRVLARDCFARAHDARSATDLDAHSGGAFTDAPPVQARTRLAASTHRAPASRRAIAKAAA